MRPTALRSLKWPSVLYSNAHLLLNALRRPRQSAMKPVRADGNEASTYAKDSECNLRRIGRGQYFRPSKNRRRARLAENTERRGDGPSCAERELSRGCDAHRFEWHDRAAQRHAWSRQENCGKYRSDRAHFPASTCWENSENLVIGGDGFAEFGAADFFRFDVLVEPSLRFPISSGAAVNLPSFAAITPRSSTPHA
jgi:hypothetical protein